MTEKMRTFETGATRNQDQTRIDPEGFLSPLTLRFYANYMNKNRVQADGSIRASDNWQKGIPPESYMKSMWRHFLEVWSWHRASTRYPMSAEEVDNALGGLLFNVMGMIHEREKAKLGKTPEEFLDLSKRQEEDPWGPLKVDRSNYTPAGQAPVREQMDPVPITVSGPFGDAKLTQPDETWR